MFLNLNRFEWSIFIISLLLLSMYVYMLKSAPNIEKYVNKYKHELNWIRYEDLVEIVSNGDFILLSGNTRGEKMCRFIPDSIFSHVGILFKEYDKKTKTEEIYILDSDLGQGYKEGVRVSHLKTKLERYKGFRIGAIKKLNGKNRPDTLDILKLFEKYKNHDFDHVILTWFTANYPNIHKYFKNENRVFCGEFIALILQDLNILKRNKLPSWYVPGDFYTNKIDLESGYSCGTSYFFLF